MTSDIGLYVHVPFCLSKCPYCDFYSTRYSKSRAAEYARALKRELSGIHDSFDTVYFGGGTPMLIYEHFAGLLECVRLSENAEITVEANPCLITQKSVEILKISGIDRVSLGVQSMNKWELEYLGRRHTPEQVRRAAGYLHAAGTDNISADMIIGLENQTQDDIDLTVKELSSLGFVHISAYILKAEENTPFYEKRAALPDEEECARLYLHTVSELEKYGYKQYEISNFAKEGYISRHNMKYWRCEEYRGIGASAHSFISGVRYRIPADIDAYIKNDAPQKIITDENAGGFDEFLMLGLRLSEGISFHDLDKAGEKDGISAAADTIRKRLSRVPDKYYRISGGRLCLTPEGFLVSNTVIGILLDYV